MRRLAVLLACGALLQGTSPAWAALEISTDQRPLAFGVMRLGEAKELAQLGAYHNEITCTSTNGHSWYLKISALQPLTSGPDAIPLDNFQWQLAWTNGLGTAPAPYQMSPMSLIPSLVYVSGPNEAQGEAIRVQLKYLLTIPEAQSSGVYHTTIQLTLTEIL